MTANLLAHCGELFACGIARSGAYNRCGSVLGVSGVFLLFAYVLFSEFRLATIAFELLSEFSLIEVVFCLFLSIYLDFRWRIFDFEVFSLI